MAKGKESLSPPVSQQDSHPLCPVDPTRLEMPRVPGPTQHGPSLSFETFLIDNLINNLSFLQPPKQNYLLDYPMHSVLTQKT